MTLNISKDKAILALVAVGFLTTLVEVRYLHRGAVLEYKAAWVPTIASAVALIASLAALLGGLALRKVGATVLALVALAGLAGVYFHTHFKPDAFLVLVGLAKEPAAATAPQPDDFAAFEQEAEKEKAAAAPALAPLGITGLALIGAVAAFKGKKE